MRLAAALAAALVCWPVAAGARQASPTGTRRLAPAPAVVVLPFENLSGRPEDDWIGAGVAETVASDLRTAGATVLLWEAAFGPRGSGGSGNGGSGGGEGRAAGSRSTPIAGWAPAGSWRAATSASAIGCG